MYQEIILDHYRHPHHKGLRDPFDAEVSHINPTCGDEVTLRVALKDAGGEPAVADVSHEALGCSISQASTSVLTDMVIGKTVAEAMDINAEFLKLMQSRGELEPDEDVLGDAVAFEGVAKYPARIKCALLGWMAWKDATAQALAAEEAARRGVRRDTVAWQRLIERMVPPYDVGKFPNRWWKLEADQPVRTLMAHIGKDTYSHIHWDSAQGRTISVREAARLQGFPDGFAFAGTMNPAFRQIGNAVPPLLAAAIADVMLETLRSGTAQTAPPRAA